MKPEKEISYIIEFSVKGENRWHKTYNYDYNAFHDINMMKTELGKLKNEDKLKRFQFRIVEVTKTTEYKII